MDELTYGRLTERERLFLRLVAELDNSSEVARAATARLGADVSPNAVDNVVKRAMTKVGARSRHRAARLLVEYEDSGPRPISVDPDPALPNAVPSRLILPVPTTGRPTNDLTALQNVALIFALALGLGVSLAGLIVVARTIYQLWLPAR